MRNITTPQRPASTPAPRTGAPVVLWRHEGVSIRVSAGEPWAKPSTSSGERRRRNRCSEARTEPKETIVTTQVVILAAGMGSRLGRSLPKPLTELSDGRTIMQQQFDNIHAAFGKDAKVTIVVGYKLEHIIEAFPDASFVYNEQYDQTNTSKSLHARAAGLDDRRSPLDERRRRLRPRRARPRGSDRRPRPDVRHGQHLVGRRRRGQVHHRRRGLHQRTVQDRQERRWARPSASTTSRSKDKAALLRQLQRVADQDYFERGIELAIEQDGMLVEPVDISDLYAVEVDFAGRPRAGQSFRVVERAVRRARSLDQYDGFRDQYIQLKCALRSGRRSLAIAALSGC